MNLLPPLPFAGGLKANSLNEIIHHCVRCHEGFLTRNNRLTGACVSLAGRPSGTRPPQRMWPVVESTSPDALAIRISARVWLWWSTPGPHEEQCTEREHLRHILSPRHHWFSTDTWPRCDFSSWYISKRCPVKKKFYFFIHTCQVISNEYAPRVI